MRGTAKKPWASPRAADRPRVADTAEDRVMSAPNAAPLDRAPIYYVRRLRAKLRRHLLSMEAAEKTYLAHLDHWRRRHADDLARNDFSKYMSSIRNDFWMQDAKGDREVFAELVNSYSAALQGEAAADALEERLARLEERERELGVASAA